MTPLVSADGTVWMTPPQLAKSFNKDRITIYRWCTSGFVIQLGYKLRRLPKGHYLIGIPHAEYVAIVSDPLTQPATL